MTEEKGFRGRYKGLWLIAFFIILVVAWAGNFPAESNSRRVSRSKDIAEQSAHQFKPSTEVLSDISPIIARKHGPSAKLVHSIIQAESNGDAKAVSPKGAMGLMQLMPETAREYQVSDPFDPEANINGGVRYLKDLLNEFSGNLSLALAAYNAGPAAVRKYQGIPPYPETEAFVKKVQEIYQGGGDLSAASIPVPKNYGLAALDKINGEIRFNGSPRDLAIFLKYMRKEGLEVRNQ